MPQINLRAKLQAYSRSPFYTDYIRQPDSMLADKYDPNLYYVFKNNQWVDLAQASSEIGTSIDSLRSMLVEVEEKLFSNLQTISCSIDYDRQSLVFTNNDGQKYFYALPSAAVDNITIGLNDMGNIAVIDTPDNASIKVVNVEYEEDPILGIQHKVSGKLRAEALFSESDPKLGLSEEQVAEFDSHYISGYDIKTKLLQAEKNIRDLEEFIQGKGGFLDPINFGKSLVSLSIAERYNLLTTYAQEQLFNGVKTQVPDQTKIKNLWTGNIWVYVLDTDIWVNEGQDKVVAANNAGILGSVTGVAYDKNDPDTKFKVSIETTSDGLSTGVMSVNGLAEEFDKVVYRLELQNNSTEANSIVQRTGNGTIIAEPSTEDNEVITQGQMNALLAKAALSDEDILNIIELNFEPLYNNGRTA